MFMLVGIVEIGEEDVIELEIVVFCCVVGGYCLFVGLGNVGEEKVGVFVFCRVYIGGVCLKMNVGWFWNGDFWVDVCVFFYEGKMF